MRNRYYLVAILVLIADCISKWLVRLRLDAQHPVDIIPGYLSLSSGCNPGVAFSFLSDIEFPGKPYVLALISIVAIVVIVLYRARMPQERKLLHLALAIVTGGILGNFVDRVTRGCVVDFIDFHIHEAFYWPTFNIADSAITVGIGLLLIDTVINPTKVETSEQSETGSPS